MRRLVAGKFSGGSWPCGSMKPARTAALYGNVQIIAQLKRIVYSDAELVVQGEALPSSPRRSLREGSIT